MPTMTETDTVQTLDIRKEIIIATTPEIAFEALLEELGPEVPAADVFPVFKVRLLRSLS